MSWLFGPPDQSYSGKNLRLAHLRLIQQRGFSPDDFERGLTHFADAMRELGSPEVRDTCMCACVLRQNQCPRIDTDAVLLAEKWSVKGSPVKHMQSHCLFLLAFLKGHKPWCDINVCHPKRLNLTQPLASAPTLEAPPIWPCKLSHIPLVRPHARRSSTRSCLGCAPSR